MARHSHRVAAFMLMAVVAASSEASTTALRLNVTAQLVGSCQVRADAIDFGNLAPGVATAQADAAGALRLTCTNGVAYEVGLSLGANVQGLVQRRMQRASPAGSYLNYELYKDATRSNVWRDNYLGIFPGWVVNGTGNGAVQVLTIYARLPAGQTPPAGTYLDTVTATVTY